MDKKSIVNDLHQAAVISVLAAGNSMLGKKILCITPPSIQKFGLEDTGKLVAIVAASEMTREYLIKQKILPDRINISKNGECSNVDWRSIQGPIGTTIIFRQCVSHIFYKKKHSIQSKSHFFVTYLILFFNKNFQLLIYSTNTFFMQHWGYQDDFKVNMSPENI